MTSRFVLPFADVGAGITPSSGAKLFFYETGTTTPKDTYSDSAGTIPNANPVIANSLGVFPDIFITGAYKVVLKNSADVQSWSADPVDEYVTFTTGGYVTKTELAAAGGELLVGSFDTVADALAGITSADAGKKVSWLGYYAASDGGSGWGIVKTGAHTDDGGSILSAGASLYIEQNLKGKKLNVKKFGATGDGSTDDYAAFSAAVAYITGSFNLGYGATIFIPRAVKNGTNRYVLGSTLEIPPAVNLVGEGTFNGENAGGSHLYINHDGVGIRFVRRNPGSNLVHNGGMRNLAVTGLGSSATTAQRLVELGDSTDVTTTTGAWGGTIENCLFNNTYGYAIYSAHSQQWRIVSNYFVGCRRGVYYKTVTASAQIIGNQFECSAAGLDAVAIFLGRGSLGGATGAIVKDNYIIGARQGLWLSNQLGTIVHGNTFEGCKKDAIKLDKYLEDGATLDVSHGGVGRKDGCEGFNIAANTFILWGADGSGNAAAVAVSHSRYGYIGQQSYSSPNASATSAIRFFEAVGTETENNIIVEPVIRGANSTVITALQASNAIAEKQTFIQDSGIKLSTAAPDTTSWTTTEKGSIYLDGSDNPHIWTGSAGQPILRSKGVSSAAVSGGASALPANPVGYVSVFIDGANRRIPYYD